MCRKLEKRMTLNNELGKGAVGTLEALKALERKLQDINEASMKTYNLQNQDRPNRF